MRTKAVVTSAAHHRDDDEEIGVPGRDAVDPRRLPDLLVDAAQAGEQIAMITPGPARCRR